VPLTFWPSAITRSMALHGPTFQPFEANAVWAVESYTWPRCSHKPTCALGSHEINAISNALIEP